MTGSINLQAADVNNNECRHENVMQIKMDFVFPIHCQFQYKTSHFLKPIRYLLHEMFVFIVEIIDRLVAHKKSFVETYSAVLS